MPFIGLAPLVGIGPMGPIELILILAVVVIIFGVGRLPEVGGALGKGIREFRKASKEGDDEPKQITQAESTVQSPPSPPVQQQTPALVCNKCGTANTPGNRFCGQCGTSLEARV